MKRAMALAVALAVVFAAAGCRSKEDYTPTGITGETRVFEDSTGRAVVLPEKVTRIAVTGPMAQMVVYSFAPELLVGWSSRWSEDAQDYIPEKYLQLPVLGQLYGSKGEMNLEELIAVSPDVVVDIGEAKNSVSADMEALSAQTGIPFVHIDAGIQTMGEAYRKLGELTALAERAEEYAQYCDGTYDRIKRIMTDIGEENKVSAVYCLGATGCNVIARGSYQSEIIDMIADNAAVVDNPSAKGTGNEVDPEQLLKWNPEFIIFGPDSIYDTVVDDPTWKQLSAIKSGNYVKVPGTPYNWLGFPPSVQRFAGMMWLTAVLYPEKCTFDIREEIKLYYKMFYHTELSDEAYEALVKESFVH